MTTRTRCHDMPFGAVPSDSGVTRFRLWAPGAQSVELCLSKDRSCPDPLPLIRQEEGWFALETRAAVGQRYHYRIDQKWIVPDPASRFQPKHVHGESEIVDPHRFSWPDATWYGRPWHEAIIHEVHVGTFSLQGTYDGVSEKLDYLADLGVTALELMPLADFPGGFGWGYDGVALFAPCARYGHPDSLKRLIAAAHDRGMMVLLDVVYNHFGPEGNYLHCYAPSFFHRNRHTPWGTAIRFAGLASHWVRRFFIENALYWLEEFHLDGLRLDAVQAIMDPSPIHFLDELHASILAGPGRERHVHLVLENGDNAARFLQTGAPAGYPGGRAQWNDDFHHSIHVLATGERDGYYRDYCAAPSQHLGRTLGSGFSFQGEFSDYFGMPRGSPSDHLPSECFVQFLQNHDQIGNRPQGERLHALVAPDVMRALTALLLLAPQPPMLFMGQEWGSIQPFYFFSDLEPGLWPAIISGRSREFVHFFRLSKNDPVPHFPDPTREQTFLASKLDWNEMQSPGHQEWLQYHKELLKLRKKEIWPRLDALKPRSARVVTREPGFVQVAWSLAGGETLYLLANLSCKPQNLSFPAGRCLHATASLDDTPKGWFTAWFLGASG
ncbi:MAG: malto-oligosyltrehalose trehalohydrolase [Magnetococcales bacterium]|nr:malto-oligosyltrehalose trehalohydrolase [Magnetococcales bacterium]